jgi:hypothetical protein
MLATDSNYLQGVDLGLASESAFFNFKFPWFRLDWNIVLRNANAAYDQLLEAASKPSYQERRVALVEFEGDLNAKVESVRNPGRIAMAFLNTRARSTLVGDTLIGLMMPALDAAISAEDRAVVLLDLTRVAAALAVYRAEQGEYPDKLDQLVPGILEKLPEDMYSGNPFKYSRKPDGGYVLYSVFQNGIDDRGTSFDGEIVDGEWLSEECDATYSNNAGDLVIRVPAPEFQLPASPLQRAGEPINP